MGTTLIDGQEESLFKVITIHLQWAIEKVKLKDTATGVLVGETLISWAATHSLESCPLGSIRDLQSITFWEGGLPAMWQWQNLSVPQSLTKGSLLCNCTSGTPRTLPGHHLKSKYLLGSTAAALSGPCKVLMVDFIWVTSSVLLKLCVVIVNEAHWKDIFMTFLVGKASGKYLSWNDSSAAIWNHKKWYLRCYIPVANSNIIEIWRLLS